MSTVAIVDNPRRKRKTPPRYKSGPKKGQFMPRKARRNPSRKTASRKTAAKRKTSRRKYSGGHKSYITRGPRKGQRRGSYVMKSAKRKTAGGRTVKVKKRYYRNPGSSFVLMNPRRRKGNLVAGVAQLAGLSAVAFGGALATRKLVAVSLREHDVGWKGYLANGGLAIGLGLLTGWATKMPDVGAAVTIGGGVALAIRIANEKTSAGSPFNVGRANYQKRRELGRADYRRIGTSAHDLPRGFSRSRKGRLAGSYAQRPGDFGRVRTSYFPARTRPDRLSGMDRGGNWSSNFASNFGRARYVPA